MTNAQAMLRKQLLAKIHTHHHYKIVKENGAWEDFLLLRFGVESAKFLSINELYKCLDCLSGRNDELGFAPDNEGRAMLNDDDKITPNQIKKINHLCENLGLSEVEKAKFFHHQIGALVTNISTIKRGSATKIITGLNALKKYIESKK